MAALDQTVFIPIPPFLPLSKAQLILHNVAASTDFGKAICLAAIVPVLCGFWQDKLNLSNSHADLINMDLFHFIHQAQSQCCRFLVWFLADKLQTQAIMHSHNPFYDPTCHYCGEIETQFYLTVCCQHSSYMLSCSIELQEFLLTYHLSPNLYTWFFSLFTAHYYP